MPKVVLSAEDRVAILSAPPETTHPELARTLGRPWPTIARFRSRVRRAGGWYTRPGWTRNVLTSVTRISTVRIDSAKRSRQ